MNDVCVDKNVGGNVCSKIKDRADLVTMQKKDVLIRENNASAGHRAIIKKLFAVIYET